MVMCHAAQKIVARTNVVSILTGATMLSYFALWCPIRMTPNLQWRYPPLRKKATFKNEENMSYVAYLRYEQANFQENLNFSS